MERRNFLIGMGSTAAGASALIGSCAFSRVRSQRNVTIQVAKDSNAYLGLKSISDSKNSQNYVSTDTEGHLKISIGKHDDYDPSKVEANTTGEGVNSDSFTFFDDLFEICNQGKAKATISYELPAPPSERNIDSNWTAPDPDYNQQVVAFYYYDDSGTMQIIGEGQKVDLKLGDCEQIGLRTVTKGVDATINAPLIDGDIVVTADAPGAGSTS